MKKHLLAAVAALALGGPAYPALASQTTIPDSDTGMGFADSAALMRAAAMHQPTFTTKRTCSLAHECATVEFAVREGATGADYFIYPDKTPKNVIWCYVDKGHEGARFCQKAGAVPRTTVSWMEAYFPLAGEFREITYGGGHIDPDCAAFQRSKYEMDDAYAACIVHKSDAATKAPSQPVQKQEKRNYDYDAMLNNLLHRR